jgi:hypothetical protein
MPYEFEPTFSVNTEDLSLVYTGSGVHNNKDVTIFFDLIDPEDSEIFSDYELQNNPLIQSVKYDILDIDGNLVYDDFLVAKTRSITFTYQNNVSLFGEYQKDFGIRATVYNTINEDLFTAEFYLYGNTPEFSGISYLNDGGFTNPYLQIYPVYDKSEIGVVFNNNSNYINYDKVDLYYSNTGFLSEINSSYFFASKKMTSVSSAGIFDLIINVGSLSYDIPYYFTAIPYSILGSGDAFYFGPITFKPEFSGQAEEQITNSNQFQLIHGESSMNLDFITGHITGSGLSTIDIIERGLYNTISYTTQIIDGNNTVYSSELKLVDTNNSSIGSGISISEYAISSNSNITYSIQTGELYAYLNVSGVIPTGIYKLYKTSI